MNLTEINIREKEFHNNLHSSGNPRSQNKYYKALNNLYEDFLFSLKNKTPNKNVLDFGCGNGVYSEKVIKLTSTILRLFIYLNKYKKGLIRFSNHFLI